MPVEHVDPILAALLVARTAATAEPKSRETSLVLTKIEEALLWRQVGLGLQFGIVPAS